MLYIHDTMDIRINEPTAVSIGKFDGFHRGHRYLISNLKKVADEHGLKTLIFTFGNSPLHFISGKAEKLLCTKRERQILSKNCGADYYIEYPFTEEVRKIPADVFLKDVLYDRLMVRHIVTGPDCRFGYKGEGDVEFLREYAPKLGMDFTIVTKQKFHGEVISSTRIRHCLIEGQIEQANRMLGYNYGMTGKVVHGNGIGGVEFGFPTINQEAPVCKRLPMSGVYLAKIILEEGVYYGMSNVGRKPTIASGLPVGVETYVFGYSGNLYEQRVRVEFLKFIRPELTFDTHEELRAQLIKDKETAEKLILDKDFDEYVSDEYFVD
ncbi:MAG: riboflavin biosynthesis protein RibF [Lachnospiraceae bacterium]|nr:riboflavin biosynthesis protein RibF [Lachnospiraceae bacterium]